MSNWDVVKKDDGLQDMIDELRAYGNARKGELAGMVLEAANRLEVMDMRLRLADRRWITDRDPTPEEVEQAGDIGFILCISGQIGSAGFIHAVDMCDNSFEDGKWYLHGAYPSKTVDLRGEEHEVFKVHGWMLPPEAC